MNHKATGMPLGRPKIVFTIEQTAALVRRYETGEAMLALGLDYGISTRVVARILRENGARVRLPYEHLRRAS